MKLLYTIATLLALAASVVATGADAALCPDADSTPTTSPTPATATPAPSRATPEPTTVTPEPTTVTPTPTTVPPPVSLVRVTSPTTTVTVTNPDIKTCYRLDACSTEAYRKISFANLQAGDNLLSLALYTDAACKTSLTAVVRTNGRPVYQDNTTANSGPFKSFSVYLSPLNGSSQFFPVVLAPCL